MSRIIYRRHKSGRVFFIVLAILLISFPVVGQEQDRPEQGGTAHVGATKTNDTALMPATVELFKKHISPIDGDRCPMYPSCSQYSLDAFNKHGLLMGWIMTCDRLLRCGRDEMTSAPRIMVNGRQRCYDSVENNDFWWER